MAWLSAPAPTICTSTVPACRMTPAMRPATAFGFERLETLRTSTGPCCDGGVATTTLFDAVTCMSWPERVRIFRVDPVHQVCVTRHPRSARRADRGLAGGRVT